MGLEQLSENEGHEFTEEEWEWIQDAGLKIDSKDKGKVNKEEFTQFALAFEKHFGFAIFEEEKPSEIL